MKRPRAQRDPTTPTSLPTDFPTTRFAWQGFILEHPRDWLPITLTGRRAEGYVRIASDRSLGIQVRWKAAKKGQDLEGRLDRYFDRLRQMAKKQKLTFTTDVESEADALQYRWVGAGQGRGAMFYSDPCGRVFFVEVTGERKDQLLPWYRRLIGGFESQDRLREAEEWSLYGLRTMIPGRPWVEKVELLSGRTTITLRTHLTRYEARRWGFAEQLLAKHKFEDWAPAALRVKGPFEQRGQVALVTSNRLRWPVKYGLARVDFDQNQILTLRVSSLDPRVAPRWDGLPGSED